jgi:hypothetical protein
LPEIRCRSVELAATQEAQNQQPVHSAASKLPKRHKAKRRTPIGEPFDRLADTGRVYGAAARAADYGPEIQHPKRLRVAIDDPAEGNQDSAASAPERPRSRIRSKPWQRSGFRAPANRGNPKRSGILRAASRPLERERGNARLLF